MKGEMEGTVLWAKCTSGVGKMAARPPFTLG